MTQGQGNSAPLYCPGCGGLMHKATGSTLYWHADTNHARCAITTIVETLLEDTDSYDAGSSQLLMN